MQGHEHSTEITEVLRKYLPELSSPEIGEWVADRLGATAAADCARGFPPGAAAARPPAPYDPLLDPGGLFQDYFTHFVRPWAERIRERAGSSPAVADKNTVADDFLNAQVGRVSTLMMRGLTAQLHRRRAEGLLAGETPEERYAAFRRWTNSRSGHDEMLRRLPWMFHVVEERVGDSARHLLGMLDELENRRDALHLLLPGSAPDRRPLVTGVVPGEGDTHHGGRSVTTVVLDGGDRVLYKPRNIAAETGYHAFVSWMNGRLGTSLPTVAALPAGSGGFVEFVPGEHPVCGEKEYFARIGTTAGILYLLRATDIHYENVITCAGGPVVVDTETLFTPRLRRPARYDDDAASAAGARMLHESIIGSGLLPMVVKTGPDDRGLDIGAVGYDAGQPVPYKTLRVRNAGRDDMHLAMESVETTTENTNVPVQRTEELDVRTRRDLIKSEFRRVLDHARAFPQEVAEAVERLLGEAEFRHVNNPTIFYTQLLRMVTHPDAITSPLVRSALLHRVVLRNGEPGELAAEEVRQLSRGDVPYFGYTPRSTALYADGAVVREEALEEPPLRTVLRRLRELDGRTVEHELRLIDQAFVNKLPTGDEVTGFRPDGPPVEVGRDRCLAEAVRIGDKLLDTLITGRDDRHPATWIAPQVTTDSQSQWTPGTLGYDLYGGSPGPALVLAGLAGLTGRTDYAEAARRVFDPVERQLREGQLRGLDVSVGGMTGMAGTVHAVVVARELLGEHEESRLGELAAELARKSVPAAGTDYLSGMAGALAVCLSLHRRARTPAVRETVAGAARAVAEAELTALGGPVLTEPRVTEYTGFAHGAMGIAPVLVQYGKELGDPRAVAAGEQILAAVLGARDPETGDWPRTWDGRDRSYGWCHGAPGMLMGGLLTLPYLPGAIPRATLERWAELTLARGFGNNPTYCHGDLAAVEITELGAREGLFTGVRAEELYPRLFAEVIEAHDARADTKYAYSNSLMVGEAGLAWSVLRRLDPVRHPSLLTFA